MGKKARRANKKKGYARSSNETKSGELCEKGNTDTRIKSNILHKSSSDYLNKTDIDDTFAAEKCEALNRVPESNTCLQKSNTGGKLTARNVQIVKSEKTWEIVEPEETFNTPLKKVDVSDKKKAHAEKFETVSKNVLNPASESNTCLNKTNSNKLTTQSAKLEKSEKACDLDKPKETYCTQLDKVNGCRNKIKTVWEKHREIKKSGVSNSPTKPCITYLEKDYIFDTFAEKDSDDEYLNSSSEFSKPVLCDNFKNKKYSKFPIWEESNKKENDPYSESDDEYVDSTFYQPVVHDELKSKNLKSENWKSSKVRQNFLGAVNQFKGSKVSFYNVYNRWLPERRRTLSKLQSLLREVHEEEKKYNETQVTFKELGYNSRCVKAGVENQTIDFLASLTAFISDAACGVSSFAQAVNVDSYQAKFKEIMNHDSEITKPLYISRSQCVVKYQGVEEVMRKFHSDTLSSTVSQVSNTLAIDKHWSAMKYAYQNEDMSEVCTAVCNFFDNACKSEVLENISNSLNKYISENPAALETCKSTGRAVYGAMNTFGGKKTDRNSLMGHVNTASDLYLLNESRQEVSRLKNVTEDENYRSNLELRIEDAIESLKYEMKEICDIYYVLRNDYDNN